MRVLLLADAQFSRREHAFLQRLEFGLLGEGNRVLWTVPESSHEIQPQALHLVVPYREHTSRFGRNAAYKRFVNTLKNASPTISSDAEGVLFEIVHAFGSDCWERAAHTATLCGSELVIELTSSADIRAARAFDKAFASKFEGLNPPTWCTPNARIHEVARSMRFTGQLALTPWGVHTPKHEHPSHPVDQPIAISVVCSGAEPRAVYPLLEAFAALGDEGERAMLFIDASATKRDHNLWSRAEALGILDKVTFVADMESRRDIVLETDALAIPEQMGELRTILLDAMAAGMLIISRRDPLIEATASEGVAMLVDAPTKEAWHAALRSVLEDPTHLHTFGARARERVREDRPVHKHLAAVISAYNRAVTPKPIPMPRNTQPQSL